MTRQLAGAATALMLLGGTMSAQGDTAARRAPRVQAPLPGRPGGRVAGRPALGRAAAQGELLPRQQVQQAFRERVRDVLNLDQPKMRQLNQTEQRFNRERAALTQSEKQTRLALAGAIDDTASLDPAKIDQYINQLVQAQRKRADLLEAEQKELSTFLTPLQRLQYLSLKERLNQRLQEINKAEAAERRAGPPTSQPPPPER